MAVRCYSLTLGSLVSLSFHRQRHIRSSNVVRVIGTFECSSHASQHVSADAGRRGRSTKYSRTFITTSIPRSQDRFGLRSGSRNRQTSARGDGKTARDHPKRPTPGSHAQPRAGGAITRNGLRAHSTVQGTSKRRRNREGALTVQPVLATYCTLFTVTLCVPCVATVMPHMAPAEPEAKRATRSCAPTPWVVFDDPAELFCRHLRRSC